MDLSSEKNTQPLAFGLHQEIQKDILSGELKSGSKLTEAAICKRYSVSRTPVREAFRQLEADGLIHRKEYTQIPPKVEYSLSEKGESLIPILGEMCDWGEAHRVQ